MYDLVSDAIKLLDAEGIERAAWLGLSIGGMVSMRAALTHPERVSKLVLMATDAKSESLLVKIERRVLAQVVKRLGVAPVVIPVLRKMFGKSTFRSRKELIKLWRPKFLEVHTETNSCCKPPHDAGRHRPDAMRLLQSLRDAGVYAHEWL